MSAAPRPTTASWRASDDRGSVSILILGMVTVLALIIAIVFDDGSALADRQRATDIAAQAARAGADAIVPGDGTTVTAHLDPTRARRTARAYLASAGVTGTVTATPTDVTVTVTITYDTKLLSMIGVTSFEVHGTATARPVPGLITPDSG
jgi:Flp pilus assembly protein TadG